MNQYQYMFFFSENLSKIHMHSSASLCLFYLIVPTFILSRDVNWSQFIISHHFLFFLKNKSPYFPVQLICANLNVDYEFFTGCGRNRLIHEDILLKLFLNSINDVILIFNNLIFINNQIVVCALNIINMLLYWVK